MRAATATRTPSAASAVRDAEPDATRAGGDQRHLAGNPEVHSRILDCARMRIPHFWRQKCASLRREAHFWLQKCGKAETNRMLPPGAINDGPPVTPRHSATVLLVRGGEPWELLLMRRPGGADFAPGAYVFPGGTVHADDQASGDEIRAAAVRELFEEVGILLARDGTRFAREADSEKVRAADRRAGKRLARPCASSGSSRRSTGWCMFARWVTPALLRRRYDARFFLAQLPADQVVTPQAGEVTDWLWIEPSKALASPDLTLVYATRAVLESVASDKDAAKLLSRARRSGRDTDCRAEDGANRIRLGDRALTQRAPNVPEWRADLDATRPKVPEWLSAGPPHRPAAT